ncbi:hypothetical protein H8E88_10510 [candidate division KSB1 bacterium]|nr:hypothetical protein [candidate division KSB1 bacterium]
MKKKNHCINFVSFVFLLLVSYPITAQSKMIDLTRSVIVCSENIIGVEAKAIEVLVEEIEKRTGIHLPTKHALPENKVPAIFIGTEKSLKKLAPKIPASMSTLKSEGYQVSVQTSPGVSVFLVGKDSRGVLYAVGKFLRLIEWEKNRVEMDADIDIFTSPRYKIRGHQLGYRPKTNAYDAWSVEQFDQYIRELAFFGANCIEIMPPRTDDDLISSHMKKSPMEMMIKQTEIADSYGMDVWIWYPNMGQNYTHPDSIKNELKERHEVFSKLKRIDVVFVPGGDPGDLHPNILFVWLEDVADVLHKYHPDAKIWVSPQAFRPVKEWLDSFYANVNVKYPWFGGVVFGPWVKTPLPEIRQIVDKAIPIRRYPDITHSISSQYLVRDWDLALAKTFGRECYNPRPVAEKVIHNVLDEYADGSLSYSEGINDDVNKFVWSGQDWDPGTPVLETLRDYSSVFISSDYADEIAHGILALEKNWEGALISNHNVEITLQQWQKLESKVPEQVKNSYRFQMCMLQAYYSAYIKERLIYEKELERKARAILRGAKQHGSEKVMQQAESVINLAWEKPVAQDYFKRCWEIADYLFEKIGSQISVKKYDAMPGRGDFMDYIDVPLNDAVWLLSQFKRINKLTEENKKLIEIEKLINWKNPGAGGFYNNFGDLEYKKRLADYPGWHDDPGSLKSPRISFGVGLRGEEWIHTVEAKGFDGRATPLAWMNQVTTLYDTPLKMTYKDLDPNATYKLKVAYTGRFRSKMKLVADDKYLIHDFIQTGITPIHEFDIPLIATKDGVLELSWTCGEGQRGAQVAEIWLMRK